MSEGYTISQRLHEVLSEIIKEKKPGEKLLAEPQLARRLGVSRASLREAMRTFEIQGIITRRQGSGTYVLPISPVIETGLEVLESIETLAKRCGLEVSLGRLKIDHRLCDEEEAIALNISKEEEVVQFSRLILSEGRPIAFLIDTLPQGIIQAEDLDETFTGSVLDLLQRKEPSTYTSSRCEINAVPASVELAKAFGIQRGDVLLRLIAWLYTNDGMVVDYSYSYFIPGYFRFHVVRRVGNIKKNQ
ncbi:MAG: GntR family transcriptional regulator [Anaerolineales bacterium]|nr:GntR family transcriptional regulator [Anaerolineales bacterium]